MPSTRADVPHLAWPIQITSTGREVVVEQDTLEEVAQHAEAACRVLRGSLDHDPEVGTSDQAHRKRGIDTARLAAEITATDGRDSTRAVIDQRMDAMEAIVTARISREGA